jgi:cell wall-associated NlpC family hydrolase
LLVDEKYIRDKYIGVPFEHRGRTMAGVDCWGLIILIYADLGIQLLDLENYEKDWVLQGQNYFIENYHKEWEKVGEPKLFDGVLFFNNKGIVSHAGIYLSDGYIIHTLPLGTVVSKISDIEHKYKLAGVYRLKVK